MRRQPTTHLVFISYLLRAAVGVARNPKMKSAEINVLAAQHNITIPVPVPSPSHIHNI